MNLQDASNGKGDCRGGGMQGTYQLLVDWINELLQCSQSQSTVPPEFKTTQGISYALSLCIHVSCLKHVLDNFRLLIRLFWRTECCWCPAIAPFHTWPWTLRVLACIMRFASCEEKLSVTMLTLCKDCSFIWIQPSFHRSSRSKWSHYSDMKLMTANMQRWSKICKLFTMGFSWPNC